MHKLTLKSTDVPLLIRVAKLYGCGELANRYKEVPDRICIGAQRLAIWRLLSTRTALLFEQLPTENFSESTLRYQFAYCYCAKCGTVHSSQVGFQDWVTLNCLSCTGSRVIKFGRLNGNIYVPILPVSQAVMQFNLEECELINTYLESLVP